MPNVNAPYGLQYFGRSEGGAFAEHFVRQKAASSANAIYINDLFQLLTSGFIEASTITPGTSFYEGVVVGGVGAASTLTDHLCIIDKGALYTIQGDSTGLTGGQAAVGANANVTYGAGSSTTRNISQTVLNGSTIATTSTLDLRIRALMPRNDMDTASAPFLSAVVQINKHISNLATTGI